MIPYQVDPSLHPAQPATPQLDDGFSPPPAATAQPASGPVQEEPREPPSLPAKSDF